MQAAPVVHSSASEQAVLSSNDTGPDSATQVHEGHDSGHSYSPGQTATPGTSGEKVKRTRRRQRLSCVECTRKRTKCDRQIPCGTCVSRGMAQICRWEPIVVRPDPHAPLESASAGSTITALSSRIAVLEQTILRQNLARTNTNPNDYQPSTVRDAHSSPAAPRGSDSAASSPDTSAVNNATSPSQQGEPEPRAAIAPFIKKEADLDAAAADSGDCALSLFDYEVQLAAISMAQMSLAPQDEYIGGGTVLCALHKLGDPYRYRFPFARSADSTTVNKSHPEPGNHPLTSQIQNIVSSLPPRDKTNAFINGFFSERNWEFAIPERWFRQSCEQMWRHLDLRCPSGYACFATGGCARCNKELNPHWLSLLFAVLAVAPRRLVGANAKVYFLKAMEARRLIEDVLLASRAYSQSSSVNGVVQSCIGAVLLAKYLADRGRVSDAWKLTGTALRTAQAVGLHRDPGWQKWDNMDRQERELRLMGWWALVIADRLYSFILGRPMMTMVGTFDVKLVPGVTHGDGTPNPFSEFQQCLIALFEIIGETVEQCLGILAPAYATVLEMDRKYKNWLSKLPPAYDWRRPHPTPTTPDERNIAHQRHTCAVYYLGALMNLHRPYMMHAPPILPPPGALSATMKVILNPSRERCIETALKLVRVVCECKDEAAQWDPQLPATLLQYTYFAFDGTVALMGALSQDPPHLKAQECLELIDRATSTLRRCVAVIVSTTGTGEDVDGEGDMATRAISVLEALRLAGRWDERFRNSSDGPPTGDSVHTARVQDPQTSQLPQNFSVYGAQRDGGDSSPAPGPSQNQPRYNSCLPYYTSTTAPTPIPFLGDASRSIPQSSFPFPFPGTAHMDSPSASMDTMFADVRDFTGSASGVRPTSYDFASRAVPGSTPTQTMSTPFDMLENDVSDAGIDWSMFTEIQGWPGNGLFGSG